MTLYKLLRANPSLLYFIFDRWLYILLAIVISSHYFSICQILEIKGAHLLCISASLYVELPCGKDDSEIAQVTSLLPQQVIILNLFEQVALDVALIHGKSFILNCLKLNLTLFAYWCFLLLLIFSRPKRDHISCQI